MGHEDVDSALSPSFLGEEGGPFSYEVKFLVDQALAKEITAWARVALRTDPHGDPALGGAYRIHTLYLDTPALDSYRKTPSFKKRRLRVRRYGTSDLLYLEQKTRTGEKVSKRRAPLGNHPLDQLGGAAPVQDPTVAWFQRRIARRGVVPTVRVSYVRAAFVGTDAREPSRLTLDDAIEAARESAWRVPPTSGGVRLLAGEQILELKYRHSLPSSFKDLVARYAIVPRIVSKYRLSVAALGLDAGSNHHA